MYKFASCHFLVQYFLPDVCNWKDVYVAQKEFQNPVFMAGKNKVETSGLPKGCLLYKTLQAQMLDMLDVEGVYPLCNRVEQYLEEFPNERLVTFACFAT